MVGNEDEAFNILLIQVNSLQLKNKRMLEIHETYVNIFANLRKSMA